MRVIIIDDDDTLTSALKLLLEAHNYEVETFSNALDAVVPVEAGDCDFVLVDYKMPGHDGIWFMENTNIPASTRIILVTAYVNPAVIKRMFALGVSGYLIKPFDEEELLRNLRFFAPGSEGAPATDESSG